MTKLHTQLLIAAIALVLSQVIACVASDGNVFDGDLDPTDIVSTDDGSEGDDDSDGEGGEDGAAGDAGDDEDGTTPTPDDTSDDGSSDSDDGAGDPGDDDTQDDPPQREDQPSLEELEEAGDNEQFPTGHICVRDGQCETRHCVKMLPGAEEGVCTLPCVYDLDCPDSWQCILIRTSSRDAEMVCVDPDFCLDRDEDGYGHGPGCIAFDCDDNDPLTHPGAQERCNGRDNNCNGVPDDNSIDVGLECDTGLPGICGVGTTVCNSGVLECEQVQYPSIEVCDGLDNNCDGEVDDGNPGGGLPCSTAGLGQCAVGTTLCADGEIICSSSAGPQPERCDGLDNSCNGLIDDGFDGLGDVCFSGIGVCQRAGVGICDPNDDMADPICSAVPGSPAPSEECNYIDDLCTGEVDGPFRDENGIYNTDEHCGGCGVNCIEIYDFPNSNGTCDVVGGIARCVLGCDAGGYDLNGDPSDGCEFSLDTDAIYVAESDADAADDASCGIGPAVTGAGRYPCASISQGISRAQALGRSRVLVANGGYDESITLVDGISLLGGFRPETWERSISGTQTNVRGNSTDTHKYTLRAHAITSETLVEGFLFFGQTNTSPSGNTYTLWITNSNDQLTIRHNQIFGGTGGPGARGSSGSNGNAGGAGGGRPNNNPTAFPSYDSIAPTSGGSNCSGTRALQNGGTNTCGGVNVNGGDGGGNSCRPVRNNRANSSGRPGASGLPASTGGSGGLGGLDGEYDTISGSLVCRVSSEPSVGGLGDDGANGTNGAAGAACTASGGGSIVGGHWRGATGAVGASGGYGSGGGGGGGGGGGRCGISGCGNRDNLGAHGGGGGAGGCGGSGGAGGTAGGSSISIFINGGSSPTLTNNRINLGIGGAGGDGGVAGAGGHGGAGGIGGLCGGNCLCHSGAGNGGNGGNGGHGGGGGGGCGGPAWGIVTTGFANPDLCAAGTGNNLSGGIGGSAGQGGNSLGNAGNNGNNGVVANCRHF